jgi:hypothetical protein
MATHTERLRPDMSVTKVMADSDPLRTTRSPEASFSAAPAYGRQP